jgi:hypothetical protein
MKEKSYTWRVCGFEWIKLYHYIHYAEFKIFHRKFRIVWFEMIMNDPRLKLFRIVNTPNRFQITIMGFAFGWIREAAHE